MYASKTADHRHAELVPTRLFALTLHGTLDNVVYLLAAGPEGEASFMPKVGLTGHTGERRDPEQDNGASPKFHSHGGSECRRRRYGRVSDAAGHSQSGLLALLSKVLPMQSQRRGRGRPDNQGGVGCPESRWLTLATGREQFAPFHMRKERWACIVAHRRAGKTVACVMDLVDAALSAATSQNRDLPMSRRFYTRPRTSPGPT